MAAIVASAGLSVRKRTRRRPSKPLDVGLSGILSGTSESVTAASLRGQSPKLRKVAGCGDFTLVEITDKEVRALSQIAGLPTPVRRRPCRGPVRVISAILTVVRLLPVFPRLRTCRCTACQERTQMPRWHAQARPLELKVDVRWERHPNLYTRRARSARPDATSIRPLRRRSRPGRTARPDRTCRR
jgi:hypothetical protein